MGTIEPVTMYDTKQAATRKTERIVTRTQGLTFGYAADSIWGISTVFFGLLPFTAPPAGESARALIDTSLPGPVGSAYISQSANPSRKTGWC